MNKILQLVPWIAALIFLGLWLYETNKVPEFTGPVKDVNVNVPIEKRYTDPAGNEHILIQDGKNVITKAELKNPERPRNMIDSSAMLSKIALSTIQKQDRIIFGLRDSLRMATRQRDTVTGRLSYAFKDNFVDLRFTPPTDTTGSGNFAFAYNAQLNIVQFQKKDWFLGRKRSYIDISSNDPRITIMGVKQLRVQQKEAQFGLRVQASGNFNPQSGNLGFGPAVRLDFDRFSVQGNYLYYPSLQENQWRPGIILNYDIIRF